MIVLATRRLSVDEQVKEAEKLGYGRGLDAGGSVITDDTDDRAVCKILIDFHGGLTEAMSIRPEPLPDDPTVIDVLQHCSATVGQAETVLAAYSETFNTAYWTAILRSIRDRMESKNPTVDHPYQRTEK